MHVAAASGLLAHIDISVTLRIGFEESEIPPIVSLNEVMSDIYPWAITVAAAVETVGRCQVVQLIGAQSSVRSADPECTAADSRQSSTGGAAREADRGAADSRRARYR